MAGLRLTPFICKIALPTGPIKAVIRAHSRSTARSIAVKQYPKAIGVLILGQLDSPSPDDKPC